jgi:hypothetical protein
MVEVDLESLKPTLEYDWRAAEWPSVARCVRVWRQSAFVAHADTVNAFDRRSGKLEASIKVRHIDDEYMYAGLWSVDAGTSYQTRVARKKKRVFLKTP